jgi:hypothetical protein
MLMTLLGTPVFVGVWSVFTGLAGIVKIIPDGPPSVSILLPEGEEILRLRDKPRK